MREKWKATTTTTVLLYKQGWEKARRGNVCRVISRMTVEREIKVGELVLWDFDEQICAWIWLGMKFISIIEVCCLFYYDNKPYILVCEYVLLISKLLIDKTVTWKRQSHFGITSTEIYTLSALYSFYKSKYKFTCDALLIFVQWPV